MPKNRRGFEVNSIGRQCPRCKSFKKWEKFGFNRRWSSTGRVAACKSCMRKGKSRRVYADAKGRRCKKCGRYKLWSQFGRNSGAYVDRRSRCTACTIKTDIARKLRERVKMHGMTVDEYWEMFRKQKGVCKICKRKERSSDGRMLAIDHDHDTGHVRALLCMACNSLIALAMENVEVLRSAIRFLRKNQKGVKRGKSALRKVSEKRLRGPRN